jgi:hypothetical protein
MSIACASQTPPKTVKSGHAARTRSTSGATLRWYPSPTPLI